LVLAFYGRFSASAARALAELKEFGRQNDGVPVYVVDVEKVKGIHKRFGVKNVPTVLSLEKGKVTKFIEGVQSARFYDVAFSGAAPLRARPRTEKGPRRVVVYSGPGCPACGVLKTYLRRHGVAFQDVNVAQDQRAAERLVRRSGQMAVPQTDINGRLVVGFDQAKLSRLLGIQAEGKQE
jgi:glutaredoxin-like YruB-family protein